jgi:peptidoglycan L-alanyl-D-glutamate endopeptidase CwlK
MGIINDINSLQPMTVLKCNQFIRECAREGITVIINETIRTMETQLAYFLQGSLSSVAGKNPRIYDELNTLRKKYGFWDLSKKEADTRITWTLFSNHLTGKAFDAVPLDKNGKPWWDTPDEIWAKMAECGVQSGLYPGRNFGDNPHFEDRM